ncbi:MAG TPA: hypothetical protein VGD71_20885 [Kribbella sp.]|jgi:hypothetical protein
MLKKVIIGSMVAVAGMLGVVGVAYADTLSSPNYGDRGADAVLDGGLVSVLVSHR